MFNKLNNSEINKMHEAGKSSFKDKIISLEDIRKISGFLLKLGDKSNEKDKCSVEFCVAC